MEQEAFLYTDAKFKPAENGEEYLRLAKEKPEGFISNLEDFRTYVKENFTGERESLRSKDFFKEFESNLNFCSQRGALRSAKYAPLVENLTFKEFTDLFAAFGLSLRACVEYWDNDCRRIGSQPPGCKYRKGFLCTSCCGTVDT